MFRIAALLAVLIATPAFAQECTEDFCPVKKVVKASAKIAAVPAKVAVKVAAVPAKMVAAPAQAAATKLQVLVSKRPVRSFILKRPARRLVCKIVSLPVRILRR